MREGVEFVAYVVTKITGDPGCFRLEASIDKNGVLLLLTIENAKAGRVLGTGGLTALNLRGLLRALGSQNHAKYNLRIKVAAE